MMVVKEMNRIRIRLSQKSRFARDCLLIGRIGLTIPPIRYFQRAQPNRRLEYCISALLAPIAPSHLSTHLSSPRTQHLLLFLGQSDAFSCESVTPLTIFDPESVFEKQSLDEPEDRLSEVPA